jgi:predicted Mrr-cat superfamily restriction endonuclease
LEIAFRRIIPDAKPGRITNWVGQIWAFAKKIERNDLIVLLLKGQNAIAMDGDAEFKGVRINAGFPF